MHFEDYACLALAVLSFGLMLVLFFRLVSRSGRMR
jgi:hypothetical protein